MSKYFTNEQCDFITRNHKGTSHKAMAELLYDEFGIKVSKYPIGIFYRENGLSSGLTGRFEKGRISPNKGLKQEEFLSKDGIERSKKTRFKKGQRPTNYKKVGSRYLDKSTGFIYQKIQDHGTHPEKWKQVQRLIWEEHHGPIPEDHMIIFLNGDRGDLRIENLSLVTRGEHAVMNNKNLRDSDPDITKIGINIAKIATKTSPRAMKERNEGK